MESLTFISFRLFAILLLFGIVKAGEYIQLENGNKYYVQSAPELNLYDAKALCADLNMTLITPDTEERQMDVEKIYKKQKLYYVSWTSGQAKDDLNFVWTTTGNNLNYTNWCAGEPLRDRDSKSQCLVFDNLRNNCWLSFDCSRSSYIICEESHLNKAKNICIEFKAKYYDLEIVLNETKHEVEDLQMQIQEISRNQTLAIELLEINKNLEIDNIKKELNETKHKNEDLQMKMQEMSKNQSLAIQFLENKKNLEIDNIRNVCDKEIGSVTNDIMSPKQSTAMSSKETGNSKTYYLLLNINKN